MAEIEGEQKPTEPNVRASGILFQAPSGKVLILRRTDTGEWAFPGGHIEVAKSPMSKSLAGNPGLAENS